MLIPSVLISLLPALFYIAIVYWFDRYEKEPWWLLSAAFLWGAIPAIILAVIGELIVELPLSFLMTETGAENVSITFIGPLIEEGTKGLMILGILLFWRHELDSPLDGLIYGAMIGLGFEVTENFSYFMLGASQGGQETWGQVVILRTIFNFLHALTTGAFGLSVAYARLSNRPFLRWFYPIFGFLIALTLHSMHNTMAVLASTAGPIALLGALINSYGGMLLLILIAVWSLHQESTWIRKHLLSEVSSGILSQDQYQSACSSILRGFDRLGFLLAGDFRSFRTSGRLFQTCSELAYAKQHHSNYPSGENRARIEKLRLKTRTHSQILIQGMSTPVKEKAL